MRVNSYAISPAPGVQIENHCERPPWGVVWQTKRCLKWIDRRDFNGIAFVLLTDEVPFDVSHDLSAMPVAGWYNLRTEETPPYIVLNIPHIYKGIPRFFWWTGIPTLRICRSLAHEIAHHLLAKRGYVFESGENIDDEESLANRYANALLRKMIQRWDLKLAQWLINDLAGWHFAFGLADFRFKDYAGATERFLTAWDLNPDREDAASKYFEACQLTADTSSERQRTSGSKAQR